MFLQLGVVVMDFADLFSRHHRALWLVAYSVVANSADADDILQEAAIVGLRRFRSFQTGSNFRAWMAEIVRYVGLNFRRGERRSSKRLLRHAASSPPLQSSPLSHSSPVSPDGRLDAAQSSFDDTLLHALSTIEPTARACVLLRCVESLSYDEISSILDIPAGTAMSHVFRARRELSSQLTELRPLQD